jgi:hypothetical protein
MSESSWNLFLIELFAAGILATSAFAVRNCRKARLTRRGGAAQVSPSGVAGAGSPRPHVEERTRHCPMSALHPDTEFPE